jgi:hypothetical protein
MDEPPGANCEFGGTKIESGLDTNQNGVLDDGEVNPALTAFACNGETGTIVRVTPEPAGPNCEFGGQKIETGLDTNQNGMLDDTEVTDTVFVCNGEVGPPGPGGPTGPEGPDGPEAPPGEDGTNTVTDFNILLEGDEDCPQGGVRIDSGPDLNGNGVLDPDEITDTVFVCNGQDGSNNGCSGGNTLAGPGGMSDLSDLLGLIVLPFIVILGRRFTKRRIRDAG